MDNPTYRSLTLDRVLSETALEVPNVEVTGTIEHVCISGGTYIDGKPVRDENLLFVAAVMPSETCIDKKLVPQYSGRLMQGDKYIDFTRSSAPNVPEVVETLQRLSREGKDVTLRGSLFRMFEKYHLFVSEAICGDKTIDIE